LGVGKNKTRRWRVLFWTLCHEALSKCYHQHMAPTIFRAHGFRFFFFSREESRLHVHVSHAEGEAKFWLEPEITLAQNIGLSGKALRQAQTLIKEYENDIRAAWQQHFGS
jgi:hypothetical protein